MKPSAIVPLLCLLAVAASASPEDDAMAHSKAFERAVNARDASAILALYGPDARVVWPGEGEEAHGMPELEKLVAKFLQELPKDAKLTLRSQVAIPLGTGDVATVGHWQESFTDAAGKAQTVDLRTTEIIQRTPGGTRYLVDHASVGVPPAPEGRTGAPAAAPPGAR